MEFFLHRVKSENWGFEEIDAYCTSFQLELKTSKNHPNLVLIALKKDACGPFDDFENEAPGTILDIADKVVVARSFERTMEQTEWLSEQDDLEEKFKDVDKIEIMEEGSFLRLFYYKDEWIVSSFRSIDTRETYIPITKKNLTELFWQTCDVLDLNTLNQEYTYCFILKHPENRCIIPYKNYPQAVYLGRCNNSKISENIINENANNIIFSENIDSNVQITYSQSLTSKNHKKIINTKEYKTNLNFTAFINSLEKKKLITNKGFLVYLKNGKRVSLYYKEFLDLQELRGTNSCIKIRYLELDTEKKNILAKKFEEFQLDKIPYEISLRASYIHKVYVNTFIYKNNNIENVEFKIKKTLFQLHNYYKKTRNPITFEIVNEKLLSLEPPVLGWVMNWI